MLTCQDFLAGGGRANKMAYWVRALAAKLKDQPEFDA